MNVDRTELNDLLTPIWAKYVLGDAQDDDGLNDLTHEVADRIESAVNRPLDNREKAKYALAAYDNWTEIIGSDGHPLIGSVERAEWIISQIRPLVEE